MRTFEQRYLSKTEQQRYARLQRQLERSKAADLEAAQLEEKAIKLRALARTLRSEYAALLELHGRATIR